VLINFVDRTQRANHYTMPPHDHGITLSTKGHFFTPKCLCHQFGTGQGMVASYGCESNHRSGISIEGHFFTPKCLCHQFGTGQGMVAGKVTIGLALHWQPF